MKKVYKLRLWVKVVLSILFVLSFCLSIHKINLSREQFTNKLDKEVKEEKKVVNEPLNEVSEPQENTIEPETTQNEVIEEQNEAIEPVYEEVGGQESEQEEVSDSYTTRMTSFWSNDGYGTNECTGSGKCSWDFGVNDKGWYTYQGKLVVATATTYLASQGWYVAPGVHLYKYWEELVLTIDGVEYDAIILDSCGSSMKTDRVDLFVSNGESARDTMINVRRR